MRNKITIGTLSLLLLFLGYSAYAKFLKLEEVNPNNEKVFVDQNGELYLQEYNKNEKEISYGASIGNAPLDVVGTRTGSSTTAVGFYAANAASTTYPIYIGRDMDSAIYDIYFNAASSSSNAYFSILSSPDDFCGTATTSADFGNPYITTDVQWFDAGDSLTNKVHSTSLSTGTSTIGAVNPVAGTSRRLVLENLNSQCLALEVSASSTEIQVQLSTKQY